jgi:heat shock protein HslJ
MEQRKLVWLIPIIVVAGIIAFIYPFGVTEDRDPPVQIDQLFGSKWILQSLMIEGQEVTVSEDRRATIQFVGDGEAEGSGGCNTFFGEYQVSGEYQIIATKGGGEEQTGGGGSLSFGAIASTEMACLESGLMEQENQFFSALNTVASFQVMPDSLTLSSQDEQTVLRFGLE